MAQEEIIVRVRVGDETVRASFKTQEKADAFRAMSPEVQADLITRGDRVAREEEEAKQTSGLFDGFLAGMTNSDAAKVQWLFERRFPLLAEQGVDASQHYFYGDGDSFGSELYYYDPSDNEIKREFADIGPFEAADLFGPFGETLSFLTETGIGITGTTLAALGLAPYGPIVQAPGIVAAGSASFGAGRYLGDNIRAGISYALDGPIVDREQIAEDAKMSAIFGAIPFGSGVMTPIRSAYRAVGSKFTGPEGQSILKTLVTEGGDSADDYMRMAKDKFGITLTRAEASGLYSNAAQIQRYLQVQPGVRRIFDFYNDRAMQMEEELDVFFDKLSGGVFVTGAAKERMDKYGPLDESAAIEDFETAYNSALETLLEKRRVRAQKMYRSAFDVAEDMDVQIDISDIVQDLRSKIADDKIGTKRKGVYRSILKNLELDPVEEGGERLSKSNLEALDEAVKDLGVLYESLAKQPRLASPIAQIKSKLTKRLEAESPDYAMARKVWSADSTPLQLHAKGFLGRLSKAVAAGDPTRTAAALKQMFKPSSYRGIDPKAIRELKRLIQEEDPRVWQNLKADWLRQQLSEAATSTASPWGVPNKFLKNIGIQAPRSLGTAKHANVQRQRQSQVVSAYQEILEPDEFEAFKEILGVTQAIGFIATHAGSPTQPFQTLARMVDKEAGGLPSVVAGALRAAIELPQRIVLRGFDDVAAKQMQTQKEFYEGVLIDALIDGESAAQLAEALGAISLPIQFITQSAMRGGYQTLAKPDPSDLEPAPVRTDKRGMRSSREPFSAPANVELKKDLDRLKKAQEETETSRFPLLPSLQTIESGGGFTSLNPALSPTILPSAEDRELAMRQQQARRPGGIGALV